MRLVITGGAGFVGARVARLALERGHDVVALDDLSTGRADAVPAGATWVEGDVRDAACVETVLEGGDLDGPTSVAFGRTWDDFLEIYVTNGSFPGFSAKNTPTLMRYRVGVPGAIPY